MPLTWVRGPAFLDRGEFVVLQRAETYIVPQTAQPAIALMQVKDSKAAIRFASSWGLLWQGPGTDLRERLSDIVEDARQLAAILGGWQVIAESRIQAAFSRSIRHAWRTTWRSKVQLTMSEAESLRQSLNASAGSFAMAAHAMGRARGRGIVDRTPTLHQHAYAMLARLVELNLPVVSCGTCGSPFAAAHGRTRYCSPACANRARQRRFRKERS